MDPAPPVEITALLQAWAGGDLAALDRLTPLVYDELRRRAHRYMADQHAGITLQPTALVNSGPHTLVLSPAILVEVQRLLTYPHVQARWPLGHEAIGKYLVYLEAVSVLVESESVALRVVSDPDDDPILQTAIAGHADVLCTRDEAFRHEAAGRVCSAHRIRILDDIALMQELRRQSAT